MIFASKYDASRDMKWSVSAMISSRTSRLS